MTWAIAAIVILAVVLGLSHKSKASKPDAVKPAPFPFPVTPSDGDTYATAQAKWVYADGWRLYVG